MTPKKTTWDFFLCIFSFINFQNERKLNFFFILRILNSWTNKSINQSQVVIILSSKQEIYDWSGWIDGFYNDWQANKRTTADTHTHDTHLWFNHWISFCRQSIDRSIRSFFFFFLSKKNQMTNSGNKKKHRQITFHFFHWCCR